MTVHTTMIDKLFNYPDPLPDKPDIDGKTYDRQRDKVRLTGQNERVFNLMKDRKFRTLGEISAIVGAPESSVSARLRDLRKPKFGGHSVYRRSTPCGLWEYQLIERVI